MDWNRQNYKMRNIDFSVFLYKNQTVIFMKLKLMAPGVGFEPTRPVGATGYLVPKFKAYASYSAPLNSYGTISPLGHPGLI